MNGLKIGDKVKLLGKLNRPWHKSRFGVVVDFNDGGHPLTVGVVVKVPDDIHPYLMPFNTVKKVK